MILKNNFQRHLLLSIIQFIQNLYICLLGLIFKAYLNIPFYFTFIIILCFFVINQFDFFELSNEIFKNYCNKDCKKCSMWHCEYKKITDKE